MRILTMTTLYPNAAQPAHGIFVENRLAAFAEISGADIKVIAPVPWFPVAASFAGKYAAYARAPHAGTRRGIGIIHPRYAIPPKIGMSYAASALERCFYKAATALLDSGWDFDLIDAHFLYPDGVAAARAAKRLGKPCVLTARGSDVSLYPAFPRQREMILRAIMDADAVIAVAAALKDELVRLGAPAEKISVLRNGVDLETFRPLDRAAIRKELGLRGNVVASVGHLIERKGHHLAIEAMKSLPDATLLIAGEGEERAALARQAAAAGLESRVRFLGSVAHEKLGEIYNAADALLLASSREGWPNVLLEAMACGTPAVATPVWGNVEIIRAPAAGRLAKDRSAQALAEALKALFAAPPGREATRLYAEGFSWEETAISLNALFEDVIERRRRAKRGSAAPMPISAEGAPELLVTVDAEEIFDWSRFDGPSRLAPASDIDRFQRLARGFGVKPLYFLTFPLIDDEKTARYFRALHETGAADLGLHLHQWATPPLGGFENPYYSFQCNLPDGVHRAKLAALAGRFEAAFGFRARAHRAGRYGILPKDYAALASIGVDLDFSPSAAFDFSKAGGPDFRLMRNDPFFMMTGDGARVAATPVCGGAALRGGRLFLARPDGARLFPRALLSPARLTCEGVELADLKALTQRLLKDGARILTFSLHSTTMTPGASPYAKDAAGVERALRTCRDYFAYFSGEIGGAFASLDGLASLYGLENAAQTVSLNRTLSASA